MTKDVATPISAEYHRLNMKSAEEHGHMGRGMPSSWEHDDGLKGAYARGARKFETEGPPTGWEMGLPNSFNYLFG